MSASVEGAPLDRNPAETTVIVVAYAHERFVLECLASIEAQTEVPRRVLIADDCSPDGTAAVIERFCSEHPRFEFHPNESSLGLNRTLNRMLALVDTPYVTYISADDTMLPGRIATHRALLDANPDAVLAYSDAVVIDGGSRPTGVRSSDEFPWPADERSRSRPFSALLETNWMPAASLFLRTAALRAAGGYCEEIFFEDFELLVRLSRDHVFVWTEEPLVAVRRLETSLPATGFAHSSPRFIVSLDTALRHYEGTGGQEEAVARARRWELAKRAIGTDMPRREAWRLLRDARRGASSHPAAARHAGRLLTSSGRALSGRVLSAPSAGPAAAAAAARRLTAAPLRTAATLVRRRPGALQVQALAPGGRGGNIMFLWQWAHLEHLRGRRAAVVRSDLMDDWIAEFPLLQGLVIDRERVSRLDQWVFATRFFFDRDFDREQNRTFCRNLLASSSRFAERLDRLQDAIGPGTIVVNVRRGDYYSVPEHAAVFGMDIERHVREALAMVEEQGRSIDDVLIVSDDVDWCREHLRDAVGGEMRTLPDRTGPFDDLAALASARTLVLANSTFSYWGSYLAATRIEDHLAIAPPHHQRLEDGGTISPMFDPRWPRTTAAPDR